MPSYWVVLTSSAARDLKKLPTNLVARILPRLELLASNPRPPGCKKLHSGDREWRIRVGDYRIVYTIDDKKLLEPFQSCCIPQALVEPRFSAASSRPNLIFAPDFSPAALSTAIHQP